MSGDTSTCVKLNCGILAMLDHYIGAAKCQGGIIQDRRHGRFSQWQYVTIIVLTVMYWSFYTQIISGIKGSSFRSFRILNFIINNAPQAGHFLGADGHQKVSSHRLRHTARHTNYSMYNVLQVGY